MLEIEQQKVANMRKRTVELETVVGANEVVRSVMGVPGVPPPALIEAMSGRLIHLQGEATKAQAALKQAHTQVEHACIFTLVVTETSFCPLQLLLLLLLLLLLFLLLLSYSS